MRRILLCTLLLGTACGNVPVGEIHEALNSCNVDGDCTRLLPMPHGTCVTAVCNNHACQYAMDMTACPMGCTTSTQAADCNLGATNCFIVQCKSAVCDFSDYSASSGCQCLTASDCATANSCQNAPTCNSATCTYTAKQPLLGSDCCNVDGDCGGTSVCTANTCACGTGNKFCPGGTVGSGRCVPTNGCCVDADCPMGNSCQTRACSTAGTCGFVSNGNSGCCDPSGTACGGTAACMNNTCTCATGELFCVGSTPGGGSCISCPPRANATVACVAGACAYTCNSGFHDCNGTCSADTSPQSCGTSCSPCPSPANSCMVATCSAGACGFASSGASPCCTSKSDCTPANACQTATACMNNQCVFGSTGASGCCNSASDCPPPTEQCLQATCVGNQCATAPVNGCVPDMAMTAAPDLAAPAPDLSTPLSVSGGGGCALGDAHDAPSATALAVVALAVLAFALRRRA